MLQAHGFAPERVHLVYNGLDPQDFQPTRDRAAVRAELALPPNAPLLLNAGQYIPWKRQDLLLEALALLPDRTVHLALAGEENRGAATYQQSLHARAQALGLTDRVHFLGFRADLPDLMAACDAYVHAADQEPFGRVILEAMTLARPIVAPNSAGPAELLQDGTTALLAEPTSAQSLTQAITRLLADPGEAAALGQSARQEAITNFSAQAMTQGVLDVYKTLLHPPT